jgi:hypothetical protein
MTNTGQALSQSLSGARPFPDWYRYVGEPTIGGRSGHRRDSCAAAESNHLAKRIPIHPKHPERICWGCDHYCPADDLRCGNGTDRTQHPVELFGDDWQEFGLDANATPADPADHTTGKAAAASTEARAPAGTRAARRRPRQ